MRWIASARRVVSVALALATLASLSLAGCGGGGGGGDPASCPMAQVKGVSADCVASTGNVVVVNNSGVFWPILRIAAQNGNGSAGNIADGGSFTFTGVAYGSFTVTAFAANGTTELAGGSGNLQSSQFTLTVN